MKRRQQRSVNSLIIMGRPSSSKITPDVSVSSTFSTRSYRSISEFTPGGDRALILVLTCLFLLLIVLALVLLMGSGNSSTLLTTSIPIVLLLTTIVFTVVIVIKRLFRR